MRERWETNEQYKPCFTAGTRSNDPRKYSPNRNDDWFSYRYGRAPITDLDLSSTDISQKVISWAKEFEDKYEGSDYDFYQSITELGKPDGYLDAIDNFTDLKLRDAGWLTEEYILDSGRFWNSRT